MATSNILPLTIQMSALPPAVRWTPQQLADAIAARLSITTAQSYALFVSGSTAPSSNVGPWLKNGTEWWIFNTVSGTYVPITINQESLGYFIGNVAPDPTIYQFWISTTPGGQPLAVNTFYSGAWTDVYAAVIGDYMTTAAFNAAIANYYTKAETNALIAGATFPSYPAQASIETVPQVVPVDATAHKVLFEMASINPAPAPFDITAQRYIAPATGIYTVSVICQVDNNTGTASSMQASVLIYKNGVVTGIRGVDETPSPVGGRWFPKFGGIQVNLNQNDYLELWAAFNDGVLTGNVHLTEVIFAIQRISA
jgi:hypothetical protein